jgi:hypothetical protein
MGDLAFVAVPAAPGWPTESARLRAASLEALPGSARLLRLLDAARPADVAGVLNALPPDLLAEAVTGVGLPLAPPVVDHVTKRGPSAARRILTHRLVQQPEHVPPKPLTLERYLRVLDMGAADLWRNGAVAQLRALAVEALCAGTVTPEQVVEHSYPAALTLALGVCTPADCLQPGARRATGDVRALLSALLAEAAGEDPGRWELLIDGCGSFAGTFAELLSVRRPDFPGGFSRFFPTARTSFCPQNLLLSLAPPGVAADYLLAFSDPGDQFKHSQHQLEWMLSSGPLSRPLVEYVAAQGSVGLRRALVANELCPDSVLDRIAAGYPQEVLLRKVASPHLRRAAFRRFQGQPDQVRLWAQKMTGGSRRDQLLDLVWAMTDDPPMLREVITAVTRRVDKDTLTCAYGALVAAAGPEPAWALELDRTGSLDQALAPVRASMLTGTAEPLVDAARGIPRKHWVDTLTDEHFAHQLLRSDAELDRTAHFPLEALVAAHLDGRPERWAEVAWRLAEGEAPIGAVIDDVVRSPRGTPATLWTLHGPVRPAD